MRDLILERMRKAHQIREDATEYKIRQFLQRQAAGRKVRGDVGLELEIEGNCLPLRIPYVTPETAHRWTPHKDGSLRGENTEYVTSGAIRVAEVEPALTALFDCFEQYGTKLELSNRCSTHVHVNCSMFTPKPITSLIALYGIVEEAVTHWCGDERTSNPFCLRMKDTQATLDLWMELLEGKKIEEFGDIRDREYRWKYGGLNILPLFTQGSVEFRPLRGADNKDMIVKWVKFLWALREEARTTYHNPETIAQQISANGPLGLINDIIIKHDLLEFWTEVCNHPANGDNIPKMLRDGFLLVQPMLFSTKWDLTPHREEDGDVPETAFQKADREARSAAMAEQPAPEAAKPIRPPRARNFGFDEDAVNEVADQLLRARNEQVFAIDDGPFGVEPRRIEPDELNALWVGGEAAPIAGRKPRAARPKPAPLLNLQAEVVEDFEPDFEGE